MSVLVDTSAWVEYLHYTESSADETVNSFIETSAPLITCAPVIMEVTAGAVDDKHADDLTVLLASARAVKVHNWHFEDAATIYRMCRKEGITVRSLIDCLIASVAISEDLEVLHHDRDFDAIARVVPLRIHPGSLAS